MNGPTFSQKSSQARKKPPAFFSMKKCIQKFIERIIAAKLARYLKHREIIFTHQAVIKTSIRTCEMQLLLHNNMNGGVGGKALIMAEYIDPEVQFKLLMDPSMTDHDRSRDRKRNLDVY